MLEFLLFYYCISAIIVFGYVKEPNYNIKNIVTSFIISLFGFILLPYVIGILLDEYRNFIKK